MLVFNIHIVAHSLTYNPPSAVTVFLCLSPKKKVGINWQFQKYTLSYFIIFLSETSRVTFQLTKSTPNLNHISTDVHKFLSVPTHVSYWMHFHIHMKQTCWFLQRNFHSRWSKSSTFTDNLFTKASINNV